MTDSKQGLELRSVTKRFQDAARTLTVLNDVTCRLPTSGAVGIVGRSGVGKSTMLHLLGGLDVPTSGEVFLDGEPLSSLPVDDRAAIRRGRIGFIFQSHNLMPEFTALENVCIPLWIAGVERDEAVKRSLETLESVGLSGRAEHLPAQLSGGEQQRVSIARALVARPRIILADEPTGNLDVATAAEIQDLLLQKSREEGRLLVVVTHSTELASSMDALFEMIPGGSLAPRQAALKQQ